MSGSKPFAGNLPETAPIRRLPFNSRRAPQQFGCPDLTYNVSAQINKSLCKLRPLLFGISIGPRRNSCFCTERAAHFRLYFRVAHRSGEPGAALNPHWDR